MRGMATRAGVLFLVTLFVVTLQAQRRDVRGRVTDQSGAPIAGAAVELRRDGTAIRTVVSDAGGEFALDIVNLSEGSYEVRVTLPGFAAGVVQLTPDTRRSTVRVGEFTVEIRSSSLATAAPGPPPPPPPPPSAGAAPDPNNHAIVPVFYATDRNRVSYTPLSYGTAREPAKQLHLGRIDVSVPRDHQMGQLERPTIWTFWREDPARHFIVVKAQEQTYDDFYRDVSGTVGRSQRKEAFVFVHGFNVTFESAVYRTAQIAYDLGFDGAPILYSWPSLGTPTGYPVDANNSEWTIDRLHWFLEDVAAKSGARLVHVIAHSRGNFPTMNALNAIATEPHTGPRARFSQIVLTAPDVDADSFRVLVRRFNLVSERTTLYASANDEALRLSKQYQGYQRAGDVRPQIVVTPGVDSIDVSAVDTSLLGHSYYGDNTSVISDIARLLRTGSPPERRCGIQALGDALARYWSFLARATCPAGPPG
jgi:esterase/lipase superfamily enzyme